MTLEAATVAPVTDLREKIGAHLPDLEIDWLNILIYADPGAGKTWFCGTAADDERTSPALLIDVEGGTKTIRKKNIDIVEARSLGEVQKTYNELWKAGPNLPYKTVIVDSLTELQRLDMRFIMKQAKKEAKNPDKINEDVPSMREWGISLSHIRAIVRAFRDLPCNTIITALAHDEKDENGKVIRIYPSLGGKARNEIPGFMDIVGYLNVQQQGTNTVRRLQLARSVKVSAKDRTDLLEDVMEDATIPKMWEVIHAK